MGNTKKDSLLGMYSNSPLDFLDKTALFFGKNNRECSQELILAIFQRYAEIRSATKSGEQFPGLTESNVLKLLEALPTAMLKMIETQCELFNIPVARSLKRILKNRASY